MVPHSSHDEFISILHQRGLSLESITPDEAFSIFIEFYNHVRAHGCDVEKDGDMLLFQWEPNRLNLTRQFIWPEINSPDDTEGYSEDEIYQLCLDFHFSEPIAEVGISNEWCVTPEVVEALRATVYSNRLFVNNRSKKCIATLNYGSAE